MDKESNFAEKAKLEKKKKLVYRLKEVTVDTLFSDGLTDEPSLNSLRVRARNNHLLIPIRSIGQTHLFDEHTSSVLVRAARKCKVLGVSWTTIQNVVARTDINQEYLVEVINNSQDDSEAITTVKAMIEQNL